MRSKVVTDFPFGDCAECEMLEADMEINKLFSEDDCIVQEIIVFCRKGNQCRQIWGKLTEKKEAEANGADK